MDISGLSDITFDDTLNGISATDFSYFRQGYNMVLNGDMEINQRGTASVSADNLYFADRWRSQMAASSKMTMEKSTTAPLNYNNSMKCSVTATPTGSRYGMLQTIDGSIFKSALWGTASAKSITVSFWARCSDLLTCTVKIYDSSNANPVSVNYEPDVVDTWEYKTVTFAAQTSGTYGNDEGSAGCVLEMSTSSLTITSQNLYITGVKMELGGVATPFCRRFNELELCRKYYQILSGAHHKGYANYGSGYLIVNLWFPEMINVPTIEDNQDLDFVLSGDPGGINYVHLHNGTELLATVTKSTISKNEQGEADSHYVFQLNNTCPLDADYY